MQLYHYHELTPPGPLQAAFDRVTAALRVGDFRAADVKKMVGTPYYRARLNDADRLLFRFASYDGQTCLLLLELIRNHAYEKSKFLRGVAAAEPATAPLLLHPSQVPAAEVQPLAYVGPASAPGSAPSSAKFHLLDRPLFFDADQQAVFDLPTPLVIIGSAGSGKTTLTLEKLKTLGRTLAGTPEAPAQVLYVTRSAYLAENAARLYAAHHAQTHAQEVRFLSLHELVASIHIPEGPEITPRRFAAWFALHRPHVRLASLRDCDRLFEEFHGVLTGADPTTPHLPLAAYEGLGLRQSVFPPAERPEVYALFRKYLDWLPTERLHNPNLVAFERLSLAQPTYDFVVVDEVQDLTNTQLTLILRTLKQAPATAAAPDGQPAGSPAGAGRFILCGDAHQVVHPNFFSWAGLKALFFQHEPAGRQTLALLRTNYRNAPAVTALANRLLQVKNLRFGSLDRASTFLAEAASQQPGEVVFIKETEEAQRQLNARIRRSAQFAVVVLREEDKAEVRRYFDTPLVFSVHEAKGLEYENIVLVNCISRHDKLFREVAEGLAPADVAHPELRYARPADRADHHAEHYKFFLNALYVAVTRAQRSLYVLERLDQHALLPLLGLTQAREKTSLQLQTSTPDEWRREARKLDQQGRTEQAEAIREQVLAQEKPAWEALTSSTLSLLEEQAFDPAHYNRKAKDRLFAYALLYQDQTIVNALGDLDGPQKYNPARGNRMAVARHLIVKHYAAYQHDQPAQVEPFVARYGPDAPDEFGFTPLGAAADYCGWKTVAWLRAQGASPTVVDAWGRTPWQCALYRFAQRPAEVGPHLGTLHELLAPPTLRWSYCNQSLTLRGDQVECLVLNYLLFSQLELLRQKEAATPTTTDVRFVEAADLEAFLQWFPDTVVPAHRKTRRAVNVLLARHETERPYPQSAHLWTRVRPGHYLLNPLLDIKAGAGSEQSLSVSKILNLHTGRGPYKLIRVDAALTDRYRKWLDEFLEALQKHHDSLPE